MKMRFIDRFLAISVFLGVILISLSAWAANYRIIKFPGSIEDAALGVNNKFEIVGRYTPPSGGVYGFLFSNGKYTTLQFPGAAFTYAFGINDSGEIVGSYVSGAYDLGYIYQNGKYTELDYPGSAWTDLLGVNDAGDVVGVYEDSQNYMQGFLYQNGKFTKIQIAGARATVPSGINNTDEIVGTYYSANYAQSRGFVLKHGKVTTINYPETNGVTFVNGVNDLGAIVGEYVNNSTGRVDGFVRNTSGKFEHLRYPGAKQTYPQGINKHDFSVGQYGVPQGQGVQLWGFTVKLP